MVRASIIWLNYNSLNFIDVALRSIDSVLNLDFDDLEVIIVDNASSDGSLERIKKYVDEHKPGKVKVKFVVSDENRGYAGGMNLGWEAKDPESRYVAFLNNDMIVEQRSLRRIIDFMEGDETLASASGLIYSRDGKRISSARGFVSELWVFGGICYGIFEHECPGIDKAHYVTFPVGAFAVVKVSAVSKACPNGRPFIDETFLYLDDDLLGLVLWNKGYKVAYVPVRAGIHFEGLSTSKPGIGLYYGYRASTASIDILKTKFFVFRVLYIVRRLMGYPFLSIIDYKNRERYLEILKGVKDGLKFAKSIENEVGILDLNKAPYVPVNIMNAIIEYVYPWKKHKIVNFDMLRQPEPY
jgi:GT2 family glycosyltransferase